MPWLNHKIAFYPLKNQLFSRYLVHEQRQHTKKRCNCMEGLVFDQTSFCSFLDICDQILNIHYICHYSHLEIVVYSIKCYTTNVARFLGLHFILVFMECYLFMVPFSLTNQIVVNKVVCIISIIPYRSKLLSSLIFMY